MISPSTPLGWTPSDPSDNVHFVYLHQHLIYRHFSLRQMKAQKELHSFFCHCFGCPKCIFYISGLCRSYRLPGKLSASDVAEEYLLLVASSFARFFWFPLLTVFLPCSSFFSFYIYIIFLLSQDAFMYFLTLFFRYVWYPFRVFIESYISSQFLL